MRKSNYLFPALAIGLTAVSCQDYDAGFSEADFKKKEYSENFEKTFGKIDPNQDWSMATQVTAYASFKGDICGTLKIYTDAPTIKGSQLLAITELVEGRATITFDAIKGIPMLYARVENNGRVLETGYFEVKDNTITISNIDTRADGGSCPVTKGAALELFVERIREGALVDYLQNKSTYSTYQDMTDPTTGLMADYVGGGYFTWDNDKWVGDNGYTNTYNQVKWEINGSGANANHLFKKNTNENEPKDCAVPNLYRLNGVDFNTFDNGQKISWFYPIFGDYINDQDEKKEGVFKEGIDHISLMMHDNRISRDVVYTVAEDSEVALDCIWRGTAATYDFFGYYYYDENEEPTAEELWTSTNKYILIDEKNSDGSNVHIGGSTKNTLTQFMQAEDTYGYFPPDYSAVLTGYKYSTGNWVKMGGEECSTYMNNANPAKADYPACQHSLLQGTILKLTYFGKDGNSSPSYTFPKGTKIGFFFGWNQGTTPASNRLLFSDCAKTYQLFKRTYSPNEGQKSINITGDMLTPDFTSTHKKYNNSYYEGEDVRPFAMTFSYDGQVILGFGDEVAGDKDLNDVCFIVKGNIIPPTDITPDDVPKPETASWLLACEDLGGSFDYDFNDVVLKISHVTGDPFITITPVAAGGTLATTIKYGETSIGEVHDLVGGKVGTAYGVGKGTPDINPASIKSTKIETSKDFSITDLSDFTLLTEGENTQATEIHAWNKDEESKVPEILLLPITWKWPTENTPINVAYTGFSSWVNNATIDSWINSNTDPTLTFSK